MRGQRRDFSRRDEGRDAAGLVARRLAVRAVDAVLRRRTPLDDDLERIFAEARLEPRDRAFVQNLALTTCRRLGQILALLDERLEKGMPYRAGAIEAILATAAAQLLFMDVPDHAAVDIAVRLAREDEDAERFAGLVNAVLRTLGRDRPDLPPVETNLPDWLGERWVATYGEATARAMAEAQTAPAPLDLTPKSDAKGWAKRLGGTLLPTGTIRLTEHHGPITALEGYDDGGWWVQDAGAMLPVLAAWPVQGLRVLDMCAAPGGKTAALAARKAKVTAIDKSPQRMARLAQNLDRLKLSAETLVRDARDARFDEPFDVVILDAPCSATGTIRRHPDVAWIKEPADIASLAKLQRELLSKAASMVAPGGRLVYATCSLEQEEGEAQVAAFLETRPDFTASPIEAHEVGGLDVLITTDGTLRARPDMLADLGGIDGFFVARLAKKS